jgi:hypothetical protein
VNSDNILLPDNHKLVPKIHVGSTEDTPANIIRFISYKYHTKIVSVVTILFSIFLKKIALNPMGTGVLPWGVKQLGHEANTHLHPVLKLRTYGAILPLPQMHLHGICLI